MRFLRFIGIAVILQLLSSCSAQISSKLTIAAASNLQFVIQELSESFSQTTGIPSQTVISSSGNLTAQIQTGAPYDVFLSADLKYPNALYQAGLTQTKPQVYAYGQLVLWSMNPSIELSVSKLTNSKIRQIAIANPLTAPYGKAAIASLENTGIQKAVQSKLIYGKAITQVNQFVTTKAVDVGFTAKSVVLASTTTQKGYWQAVPTKLYPPIAQGIAIIKGPPSQMTDALKFQDFILSSTAQEILQRYGYQLTHS